MARVELMTQIESCHGRGWAREIKSSMDCLSLRSPSHKELTRIHGQVAVLGGHGSGCSKSVPVHQVQVQGRGTVSVTTAGSVGERVGMVAVLLMFVAMAAVMIATHG